MKIDGACHCGEISFNADIDPSRVMLCNCTDCQVQSGGPLRMVVLAPIEAAIVAPARGPHQPVIHEDSS